MEGIEETDNDDLIKIRFVTKQNIFTVPDKLFVVPKTICPPDLSKLLVEILRESCQIVKLVEFDFVILGQLLNGAIVDYLNLGCMVDGVVEIECITKFQEPEFQNTLPHEDWIGGVQVADKWILTGCYDNTIHIWNTKGKHILSHCKHTNAIKAVSWLKAGSPTNGFISISHDSTAILWELKPKLGAVRCDEITCKPVIVLKGHERGIDAVAVSPNSQNVVTGGWDTYVKIWSASFNVDEEYEPQVKKSRSENQLITRTPLHTLKGHKECIVTTQWIEPQTICTAGMDHKMKFWDIESNRMHNEIVTEKAFLGASWSSLNRTVISCFADKHIRLYDPRTEGSSCKSTFTSHALWVSAVMWSQTDEHLFMSGSYDQTIKVWDTRFPRDSLYSMVEHEGKILCLDWSNPKYCISGGTDNNVNIFKNKSHS